MPRRRWLEIILLLLLVEHLNKMVLNIFRQYITEKKKLDGYIQQSSFSQRLSLHFSQTRIREIYHCDFDIIRKLLYIPLPYIDIGTKNLRVFRFQVHNFFLI